MKTAILCPCGGSVTPFGVCRECGGDVNKDNARLQGQCEGCGQEFDHPASSIADEEEELRYCLDCQRADDNVQTQIWLDT